MDTSKIKNYMIILLAIVNIFLLSIVLKNVSDDRASKEYATAALERVLAENNIVMSENVALPEKMPTEVTLSRSLLKERRKLSSLIGSCSAQDLGGNIIYYRGNDGQASFRGTGEFEIALEKAIIPRTDDLLSGCYSVTKRLGIDLADIEPDLITDGSSQIVSLICAWNGTPVYNASVEFSFTPDRLYLITGMRPLDTEVSIRALEDYPDSATILMSFLAYARQTGDAFSEITNVELGYFISSSASGSCVLRPVWCIVTDSGKYYINGQTGKPESLEYAS